MFWLLLLQNIFRKPNQKRYVHVKVQPLKMSTVYSLTPVGGVVFYDFDALIRCAT